MLSETIEKTKLVSVIVPVYNVETYLERCVRSVLAQKYNYWEMFLVDDGSSDKSPIICDKYAETDERIIVIHKNNEGQAVARNTALEVAKGDYIFFLDSDDYIHPDTLFDMVAAAQEYEADIVQCSYIRGNEDNFPPINKTHKVQVYNNHSIFYSRIQKSIVWGKLYRRELWRNVRMPVGKLNYEDDATTWKLYYLSKKTIFINTPYFYYYDNPFSTMATQNKAVSLAFIPAYEERIAFFEQEGDKLLTNLSKWRFCLPLLLSYMKGNVRDVDLPILLEHFYKNNRAAIFCPKVHFEHRLLIALFSCFPKAFRLLFELMGKANTIKFTDNEHTS
jgi:glycosyltransferase involved in cell wall biosynthesis